MEEKLKSVLQIIDSSYYQPVNMEKIIDGGINGVMDELDLYSKYYTKENLKSIKTRYEGKFFGIGIHYTIFNDTIVVVYPFPKSPAERAGLMSGDKIIKIDREDATGSHIDKKYVTSKLRGDFRTVVRLVVLRKGKTKNIRIIRREIEHSSFGTYFMATKNIGYIKLNRFKSNAHNEFNKILNELLNQGMRHLILDLSYNSGGYLRVCANIVNEFLSGDKLIVQSKGRDKNANIKYSTNKSGGLFKKGKLVVIINQKSASASEILAGAIQDWDRGLIIGQRSFGKGSVQRLSFLHDSSSVKYTIAKYYLPSGRSIQRPLHYHSNNSYAEAAKEMNNRIEKGEFADINKFSPSDTTTYYTKRNNRIVYGSGGITPDIFVPMDTIIMSDYYHDLVRSGVLNSFSLEYTSKYRRRLLRRNKDINLFMENFEVDDKLLKRLNIYATYFGITQEEINDEKHLKNQLKALIARNLWGFSAYLRVVVQNDDNYKKAIEIIQDRTFNKFKIYYY